MYYGLLCSIGKQDYATKAPGDLGFGESFKVRRERRGDDATHRVLGHQAAFTDVDLCDVVVPMCLS